jgi:hypothetical protein
VVRGLRAACSHQRGESRCKYHRAFHHDLILPNITTAAIPGFCDPVFAPAQTVGASGRITAFANARICGGRCKLVLTPQARSQWCGIL